MFDLEKVKTLNDLEMIVYQHILGDFKKVANSTIRQLSSDCHVSTSTVLRFCSKMGYEGFSELKYALKTEKKVAVSLESYYDAAIHVDSFFKKIQDKSYQEGIKPAIQMIVEAKHIVFLGLGTSGTLGGYGSRYFANLGMNSYSVTDPFAPIPFRGIDDTLVIVLSVSGETKEIIKQVADYKQSGVKVLSITNNEVSTIARMADYNLSYYMPEEHSPYINQHTNLTTQVPVIVLLEILAHHAYQEIIEISK